MKKTYIYIYIISYVFSFFLPASLLYYFTEFRYLHFRGFVNSIPFNLLLISPVFLLNKFSKFWLVLFYLISIVPSVLSGVHIYFFDANISYQAIASILITSSSEAKEFLESQLTFFSVIWICFLIFLPLYFFKKLWKQLPVSKTDYYAFIVVLVLVLIIFALIGKHRFFKDSQIWVTYSGICQYYKTEKEFSDYLDKIKSVKLAETYNQDENYKTLVVLIGESSSKHHWGLYGYFRDTTPRLNTMKDKIIFFKDAVSPTAFTVSSLMSSLFFKSIGGHKDFPVISILQQTGYKVYWISNQATAELGIFNYLALMSDEKIYLNRSGTFDFKYKSYDENLIKELQQILNKNDKQKKVIFLHTMGSHAYYKSRYPEEFNKFNSYEGIEEKPWRKTEHFESINNYDNSIYYTDYIITTVINILKNEKNSSLLYFSDHGEEVFDVLPFHGRREGIPSRYMVDIPVLLWFSDDMKQLFSEKIGYWKSVADRPFVTDIVSYMICDVLNIHIPETDKTYCNPLSFQYQNYERYVENKKYDVLFNGKKGLHEPIKQ